MERPPLPPFASTVPRDVRLTNHGKTYKSHTLVITHTHTHSAQPKASAAAPLPDCWPVFVVRIDRFHAKLPLCTVRWFLQKKQNCTLFRPPKTKITYFSFPKSKTKPNKNQTRPNIQYLPMLSTAKFSSYQS